MCSRRLMYLPVNLPVEVKSIDIDYLKKYRLTKNIVTTQYRYTSSVSSMDIQGLF